MINTRASPFRVGGQGSGVHDLFVLSLGGEPFFRRAKNGLTFPSLAREAVGQVMRRFCFCLVGWVQSLLKAAAGLAVTLVPGKGLRFLAFERALVVRGFLVMGVENIYSEIGESCRGSWPPSRARTAASHSPV